MSVQRYDLNACIGCESCMTVCPMDVFRFDYDQMKSVMAYPENCQSCGQCYVNCQGRSLVIGDSMFGYAITSYRATTTATHADVEAAIKAQPQKSAEEAAAVSYTHLDVYKRQGRTRARPRRQPRLRGRPRTPSG